MQTEPADESTEARLYHNAYAVARGQLVGLAQASGYPLNSRFQGLLVDLDAKHQGDPPVPPTAAGKTPDEMLNGLQDPPKQMIQHGGEAVFLRVVYHLARSTPRRH